MVSTVTVFFNSVRDVAFDVTTKDGRAIRQVIKGTGSRVKDANGQLIKGAALPVAGAYGITANVDAEVWAEIKKQYGSMTIFTKGYIKASKKAAEDKEVKAVVGGKANGEEPKKPKATKKAKKSDED